MEKVELKDISEAENITIRSLYNIVSSLKYCDPMVWKGWKFIKEGRRWYGQRTAQG